MDGVQALILSSHFLDQRSQDGIHCAQLILRKISKIDGCLPDSSKPDSPKPDSPKLGLGFRVRVRVSANRD